MNRQEDNLIFSFDVGKGSLGVAVRKNEDIIHANSLLIDENIGILEDERERRRAYRTRQAHKRREKCLAELWEKIGEKPLPGARYNKENGVWVRTAGDKRLEREFPKKGEDTVYTSCLLRIILLEGKEKLAPWQIYKALHSAIQRRGYDENVPWKTTGKQATNDKDNKDSKDDKDDEESKKKTKEFEEKLIEISADSEHHFPCYYDAYRMGLWSSNEGIIKPRIDKDTVKKARGQYITPRTMVDNEIRRLLKHAGNQLPKLAAYIDDKEGKIDELLYGEKKENSPDQDERYPAINAEGLLAQNLPRFDNRAIGKCSLIPRLHVCRKADGLFIRTSFLMSLVNFRYQEIKEDGEIVTNFLGNKEICKIYKDKNEKWEKIKKADTTEKQRAKAFSLNKTESKKIVKRLGGEIKDGHENIKAPDRISGRCRFSRPALAILHGAILSEESPQEYQEKLIGAMDKIKNTAKTDTTNTWGDHWLTLDKYKFRLYQQDLSFLSEMTDDKGRVYIPHVSLAEKYQSENDKEGKKAIERLIASCHSPVVRHRLGVFNRQLNELINEHGEPSHVCLEFIREDFMGEKRKKKYENQSKEGRNEKKQALKDLRGRFGDSISDKIIEEYRLMKEQKSECPYTGNALCIDKLGSGEYAIDHILPQAHNGPDSLYNKVLTFERQNKNKGDNLPAQWDFIKEQGKAYESRVKKNIKDPKKQALLLASDLEEAQALAEKYTGLAVTGWIARLARDIICLRMNWHPGGKDLPRNITVVSGGLVSRVAKKYGLYECLGDGGSRYVKNRDDKRHHALDAMVISYLPEWARDKQKTGFFRFPEGVNKDYFSEKLATICPPLIARNKAKTAEQPLARVWDSKKKQYVMMQRKQKEGESPKRKKVGNYDSKLYKDLSKDNLGGHWYVSKSVMGEGTSSHGCLLIAPPKGDPFISPVIHAHDSLYHIRRRYKAQGCKVWRLQRGDWVNIAAGGIVTKLGGKTAVNKDDYQIKEVMKNDYKITNEDGIAYKIRKKTIHAIIMKKETRKLMQTGGEISFQNFRYSKELEINGSYRFPPCEGYEESVKLHSPNSPELEISGKKLYGYIIRNIIEEPTLKEGDNLHIPESISANADDESNYSLPKGNYSIKKSGKSLDIQDNTGTIYRLQNKKLARLIILPDQ